MLWLLCVQPWVIDGDSIRCRNLGEIRLLGIDAAERTSSRPCREHFGNHVCDNARAKAAKQNLIALRYRSRRMEWKVLPVTKDRYGRTVGRVLVGSTDASCYQLERGAARYIPAYDNGGRVAKACGLR